MGKKFLYVGNWGFHPAPKGISRFLYEEETGELTLQETIRPDVAAGQLCLDEARGILYAVNERGDRTNEYGGGGSLLAFRIDPETGALDKISECDSLCPEPSYLCLDGSGKYILTCHCADPWHVTKVVRRPDGTLSNEVLFDDAAVVMFRLNEDGSIGPACDYIAFPGSQKLSETSQVNVDPVTGHIQLIEIISRLHAVIISPDREMVVACDKGMDKLYVLKLDRENGRLIHTDTFEAKWSSFPRYGAFHPTLPVFYSNSEYCSDIYAFRYDSAKGKLDMFRQMPVLTEDPGLVEGKPVGAQDILVHPNGKTLYVTLCGINSISVLSLDETGSPTLVQTVESGGVLPRGITISPDGRFLLSGNMVSGDITTFEIGEDGTLQPTGKVFKAVSPSAMRFF